MSPATASDCRAVRLPSAGARTVTASSLSAAIPFVVARVYYLHSVPAGAVRGGHAHRELEQVLVAVTGSFTVDLDDGVERRSVTLDAPHGGLHIPPLMWRELRGFTAASICLVLASMVYDEADYIRDYDDFVAVRSSTYRSHTAPPAPNPLLKR